MGYKNIRLHLLSDPYALSLLSILRDKKTPPMVFRGTLEKMGEYIAQHMTDIVEHSEKNVETPTGSIARGIQALYTDKIVLITVLRAAIPMMNGFLKIYVNSRVGFVSARRVEENGMKPGYEFDVEVTYKKIPRIRNDDIVVVIDPMVATGSTMEWILPLIIGNSRAKRYVVASVITTPIALEKIDAQLQQYGVQIDFYTYSVDPQLNSKGYIVPGLGDAGDRAFNTADD